jgi:hypothetical protein
MQRWATGVKIAGCGTVAEPVYFRERELQDIRFYIEVALGELAVADVRHLTQLVGDLEVVAFGHRSLQGEGLIRGPRAQTRT